MANDRIKIICRNCKEYTTFAKYYPSLGHGIWHFKSLDEFIEKHMECSPNFGKSNLGGDRCFDLITESDNNAYKYLNYIRRPEWAGNN